MKARYFGFLLTGFTLCASAQVTNLLPNSDFATDISGWTGSRISWDGTDGDPAPGSLHLSPPDTVATSSCVQMAGGQTAAIATASRITAGSAALGSLYSFTDTNCTTGKTLVTIHGITNTDNAWHSGAAFGALAGNVQSIQVELSAQSSNMSADVHFDGVAAGPMSATPVRLQSFDVR